jgi:hypothetical protein
LKFAQICSKQALKYTIFVNIQKMAKWPNHFISGKQFQKGQIGQIWQIWPFKGQMATLMYNLLEEFTRDLLSVQCSRALRYKLFFIKALSKRLNA